MVCLPLMPSHTLPQNRRQRSHCAPASCSHTQDKAGSTDRSRSLAYIMASLGLASPWPPRPGPYYLFAQANPKQQIAADLARAAH